MSSMTDSTNSVDAAVEALEPFHPSDLEQAENMLQMWARRPELTEADITEVLNRMFPEDKLLDPPACPSWCTLEHPGERHVPDLRNCESEEMFVPTFKPGVVCVNVSRTFDRVTGAISSATVRLEDFEFTEQYARHLARRLIQAADLIGG